MTPNVWSKRLQKRLSALTDAASKDSLQTLARWISFNRKHAKEFSQTIAQTMASSSSPTRSWMFWQLVDHILLQDKDDSPKFDRYEELRIELGEVVVVPSMRDGSDELLLKIKPMMEVWDNINVFGGPTLINQIKRAASSPHKKKAPVAVAAPSQAKETTPQKDDAPPEDTDFPMEDFSEVSEKQELPIKDDATKLMETTLPLKRISSTADERRNSVLVEFDFDKEGISAGKVEAREFLEPCKAVATLQITRDLRSESTVHLGSWLSAIPKDIREDLAKYKKEQDETGQEPELDDAKIEEYSIGLSSEVLDLNIEESLESARSYREIVLKLRAARQKLFHLLVKSRCEFGSEEAAKAFFTLDGVSEKLQKRKLLLLDAMDLEGLEPPKQATEEPTKELDGISWYNPDEPEAKRQKVDQ
eukprot:CAMPEP_0119004018 /NCGR_PEP_ID=MMETSP1176-20130426/898_1 /TAXON_ID=265551 /ORGANISM="Synedropsis recta cf, Strain CCMP1620" /LENGTH=417 /DNA_ID=CAMNT_0006955675 /DNA_START=65 /DNA_END=1318 /DNA_ORIENTATION=-